MDQTLMSDNASPPGRRWRVYAGIGVAMVHFALPLPLATLHNAGAALLVICTVTLLRVLRPARAIGMVPLRHGHSTR